MKKLIHEFIESLKTEKGYSVNTCRAYRKDLVEFSDYIRENYKDNNDEKKLHRNFIDGVIITVDSCNAIRYNLS